MPTARQVLAAKRRLLAALSLVFAGAAFAAGPDKTECLVGARPGGGFDLTCRLVAAGLLSARLIEKPMQITYLEGGVGAVAMNQVVDRRAGEPGLVVAASSGTALLIAQRRFGKYDETAVRWIGAVGADHGALFVAAGSPVTSLPDLAAALKKDPGAWPFGGGGAVGGQDWMKAALVARAAGVEPKALRYVALEGGGAVIASLQSGFVRVAAGDLSEALPMAKAGKIRILAVLARERAAGDAKDLPTAREQGFDIEWPSWRGLYIGPKTTAADYERWAAALRRLAADPGFVQEQARRGLSPLPLFGAEFEARVTADAARFRAMGREFGLPD